MLNTMVKVHCPVADAPAWANSTKDLRYRCTKCSSTTHAKVNR